MSKAIRQPMQDKDIANIHISQNTSTYEGQDDKPNQVTL